LGSQQNSTCKRLQYLTVALRAHQRASARATGVEEEHRELEELLDGIIGESDEFMATEAGRREVLRAREASPADGGRQARDMTMRRQTEPTEGFLPPHSHEVRLEDTSSDEDGGESATPVHRGRRRSTLSMFFVACDREQPGRGRSSVHASEHIRIVSGND
jgi:hypothetical protein